MLQIKRGSIIRNNEYIVKRLLMLDFSMVDLPFIHK